MWKNCFQSRQCYLWRNKLTLQTWWPGAPSVELQNVRSHSWPRILTTCLDWHFLCLVSSTWPLVPAPACSYVIFSIICITCTCCKLYMEETDEPLNLRINVHVYYIRSMKFDLQVAGHFNSAKHIWEDASVVAIDHSLNWSTELGVQTENS